MKIDAKDFRVREGHEVDLRKWPTKVDPVYKSKKQYNKLLEKHIARLSDMQQLLYASSHHAILLIFQAMDAAGKDGAIRHVMSGVNPQGCQVFSFKHPSADELLHDFLWRTTRDLPERGRIGIFNRSYYEEVLIVRVHPEILHAEGLLEALPDETAIWHDVIVRSSIWKDISMPTEPASSSFTFICRRTSNASGSWRASTSPKKNWKFSLADIAERKFWHHYMTAFGECLGATSTSDVPWYIVPADDKENARLIVSQIVLDTLEGLNMHYPKTTPERHKELLSIREQLKKS